MESVKRKSEGCEGGRVKTEGDCEEGKRGWRAKRKGGEGGK